jgi:hypothetical protein
MEPVTTITTLAVLWIWMGGYAQLLGMPILWLRLRRTPEWRQDREGRSIDVLARLLTAPTALAVAWGYATFLVALALGGEPTAIYLLIVFVPPLVFVPAMAFSVDLDIARVKAEST